MRPPRSFRSKSLPLVLHESAVDEVAMPLDMYAPESSSANKMQVEKWVRRSRRLLNPSDSETQTVKNSPNSRKSLKLLHASSLRRSPRLVSPNSETRSCNAKINSSRVSNSSNKSRSRKSDLRVFGEKSLRRSPRLVSADPGAKTGNAELNLGKRKRALVESRRSKGQSLNSDDEKKIMIVECLEEKFFSRSPRPSFTPSRTINSRLKSTLQSISLRSLKSPNKKGCFRGMLSKTSDSKMSASRELKTNLLSLSWTGDGNKEPEALKFYVPQLSGEKCLRRSPRLISTTENNLSNETLRRCDMGLFDKKPLTSPELSSSFSRTENIEINSTFIELSKSSDVQPSKQIEDSCQSTILETSPIGTENCKTNHMLLELPKSAEKQSAKKIKSPVSPKNRGKNFINTSFLIGDPIPKEEAQERWRWRYELMSQRSKSKKSTSDDEEDPIVLNVECHHAQATIDNCTFYIGDCAYIKGDEGQKHVGKILEFFKTTDGEEYFRVQWFYRAEDTVMKEEAAFHDKKRVFYSTVENDNLVDCIISKVNIMQMTPRVRSKLHTSLPSDFYYDMEYCVEYSTFRTLQTDNFGKTHDLASPDCIDTVPGTASAAFLDNMPGCKSFKTELALLDLYSGCGGMSTGLCLGAKLSCANLVTRWALDSNKSACESLKLNHPETYVRNESAKDFLELLKEWEKLCKQYAVDVERTYELRTHASTVAESDTAPLDDEILGDEYEVSSLVDICYGDPSKTGKHGLKFKVHWRGYDTSEDTWEPIEGLSNCPERIQDFVRNGLKSKILPLPGDVDVICGGPPCQGISGYNRYRNVESPLADERNHQIVVFMDIVKFLKPKYVLMENVTDILRFDKASLGRYALSRLVHMNYQARLGIMAAGCYGLPQFRLRVFLWGALPSHKLPQFPMPTHDVIMRYWPPPEFERNTVAYDEDQHRVLENFLEKAVVLQDAISDLPSVTSRETREEMSYNYPPETEFQRYIRSTKYEMTGSTLSDSTETKHILYDHRPYSLSEDDYLRVCQIPKRKGANFRDLPGVIVGKDNVVQRGPKETQVLLPSGKPMVPDYAFTFEQGKSKRPFARLWWDETVPTVLTFPSCHNQAALHPEQDRVLTVREYARLQGFPDYYRFCGTVKERYCQVGNAVAVPVARALGYALGMAIRNLSGNEPVMTLPPRFSHSNYLQLAKFLYPENF